VVPRPSRSRRGKFKTVAANLSEASRKVFLDTYTAIHQSTEEFFLSAIPLDAKSIAPLVKLLTVPTRDTHRLTTSVLAHLAKSLQTLHAVVLIELSKLFQTIDNLPELPIIPLLEPLAKLSLRAVTAPSQEVRIGRLLSALACSGGLHARGIITTELSAMIAGMSRRLKGTDLTSDASRRGELTGA
jgi:hypothetical protein